MGHVPGQIRHSRAMQLTPEFGAEYIDRTDKNGHDHVAVKLQNQAANGPRQEFRSDLDRLEEVVRRAEAFWQGRDSSGSAWRTERIGDYEARFVGGPANGALERLAVHLEQTKDGQRQAFTTDVGRLRSAVKFGQGVEREL